MDTMIARLLGKAKAAREMAATLSDERAAAFLRQYADELEETARKPQKSSAKFTHRRWQMMQHPHQTVSPL